MINRLATFGEGIQAGFKKFTDAFRNRIHKIRERLIPRLRDVDRQELSTPESILRGTLATDLKGLYELGLKKTDVELHISRYINTFDSLVEIAEYFGAKIKYSTICIELDIMISNGATKEQINSFLAQRLPTDEDQYGIEAKIREIALSRFEDTLSVQGDERARSLKDRITGIVEGIDNPNHPFCQDLRKARELNLLSFERIVSLNSLLVELKNELINYTNSPRTQQSEKIIDGIESEIRGIYSELQLNRSNIENFMLTLINSAIPSLFGAREPINPEPIPYSIVFPKGELTTDEENHVRSDTEIKLRIIQSLLSKIIPMSNYGLAGPITFVVSKNIIRAGAISEKKMIYLHVYETITTILHEIFHFIEEQNPLIYIRTKRYLMSRTKDEPLVRLGRGFGIFEFTKADNFVFRYMGKKYFKGTEILSLFADYLFCESTKRDGKVKTDEEYLRFVLSLLMNPKYYSIQIPWEYTVES